MFFRKELAFPSRFKRLFFSHLYFCPEAALAGPVLGGPQMAILLENLIAAGAKEILFLGWAGALRKDLPLGSLLLPEAAEGAEGTSLHYHPCLKPDQELFLEVYQELIWAGLDFRVGQVVSTDALYRETEEFCQKFALKNLAVEMECAAAFSVARFRGVKLAALLLISDWVYPERKTASPHLLSSSREALLPFLRRFLKLKRI